MIQAVRSQDSNVISVGVKSGTAIRFSPPTLGCAQFAAFHHCFILVSIVILLLPEEETTRFSFIHRGTPNKKVLSRCFFNVDLAIPAIRVQFTVIFNAFRWNNSSSAGMRTTAKWLRELDPCLRARQRTHKTHI
jgi:hypothetical protein